MDRRIIEVVEYQPKWPQQFEAEKKSLSNALAPLELSIHHIGSTSVPGLAAKPIIDILIECDDVCMLDDFSREMEALDYLVKGEYGIAGRRYFQKGGVQRSHHVHAFTRGDSSIVRHLAFRDYLIEYPQHLQAYADIKLQAVDHCGNNAQKYMDYKNNFIKEHEVKAVEWRRQFT